MRRRKFRNLPYFYTYLYRYLLVIIGLWLKWTTYYLCTFLYFFRSHVDADVCSPLHNTNFEEVFLGLIRGFGNNESRFGNNDHADFETLAVKIEKELHYYSLQIEVLRLNARSKSMLWCWYRMRFLIKMGEKTKTWK